MKNFAQNISGVSNNDSICSNLSIKTRLIGFLLCSIIGMIMIIGSIYKLFNLKIGGTSFFAIWYTLGNIIILSSTLFLKNYRKQRENIFHPKRIIASILLFVSIICCFFFGIIGLPKFLIILTFLIQFVSYIWYSLSYIPMGKTLIGKKVKDFLFGDQEDYL